MHLAPSGRDGKDFMQAVTRLRIILRELGMRLIGGQFGQHPAGPVGAKCEVANAASRPGDDRLAKG